MSKVTQEQRKAIIYGLSGEQLKISASAGTGKTSTLVNIAEEKVLLAQTNGRRLDKGLYLAFSSAIAKEAKNKMPASVVCKTAHGLAFGFVGHLFADRFSQRISGSMIAEYFRMSTSYFGKGDIQIAPSSLGSLALDTVSRFCQTGDAELSAQHIPWASIPYDDPVVKAQIADHLLFYTNKLWSAMSDVNGNFPSTQGVYLKLWALTNPRINADYILFDEAQDASGVMLDIIKKQRKWAQVVFVGDDNQSIFEWCGAVNAMAQIKTCLEAKLTQSFRFGQPIAHLANQILKNFKGIDADLKGFDQIDSQLIACKNPNAIIARTNAVLISELMGQLALGKNVGFVGGTGQLSMLISGIEDLQKNKRASVKELALFNSYAELMEYAETPSGGDLKSVIKQVDKHGTVRLKGALAKVGAYGEGGNKNFDVVVTSAHRSKGLEFDRVKLKNDFLHPNSRGYTPADANLLYVGTTRARQILDISECEAALVVLNGPDIYKAPHVTNLRENGSNEEFSRFH